MGKRRVFSGEEINDLIGKIFGRWIVLGYGDKYKDGQLLLKCKCSCENGTIRNVASSSLFRGISLSCGCIRIENAKELASKCREKIIEKGERTCTRCKETKELSAFGIYKNKYKSICKVCIKKRSKQYRKDNKESIKKYRTSTKEKNREYQRGYRLKNKEAAKVYHSQYRKNNKEYLAGKKQEYSKSKTKFTIYANKLTIEEEPISDDNGYILCKCYHCKKYFYPTNLDIVNRIASLAGRNRGENHIYCSEKCKQECDIYRSINIPKSLRNTVQQSRCNQQINREQLLQIQVDEVGYNYCEKCGNRFDANDLKLHHNIMVSKDYTEADNMSHQIIVCHGCHTHEGC